MSEIAHESDKPILGVDFVSPALNGTNSPPPSDTWLDYIWILHRAPSSGRWSGAAYQLTAVLLVDDDYSTLPSSLPVGLLDAYVNDVGEVAVHL